MFLLAACIKWFPPILVASPSPVTTITSCFGFAVLRPVANANALPCVVRMPTVSLLHKKLSLGYHSFTGISFTFQWMHVMIFLYEIWAKPSDYHAFDYS